MSAQIPYPWRAHIFANLNYGYAQHQFEYFRIAIAAFSIFNFCLFLVDFDVLLAANGMINWEVTRANAFWFEPHLYKLGTGATANILLYGAIFCYIASLISLGLGFRTRLMAMLAFGCFLLFSVHLNPYLYGVDLYQSVFLFFLCIFPSGHSLALPRRQHSAALLGHQQIALRTVQIYLMITYFSAGFGKVQMPSWLNGEFLFLSLSDPTYQFVKLPTDLHYLWYVLSGCLVVCIELLYPLLIFIPYVRIFLLLSIIGMHAVIAIFMGLVPFGTLLILVNVVIWYPLLLQDYRGIRRAINLTFKS
ncbi:hypothetical protein [Parapedobacter tibetensis]|uniref:hypothetical protein n=1 Tax=Parapedobacter tibetensis TaxID=2972951 RepID=UPI00214DCB1B|nr:hypothetical protein [Parapedobacter tibetensis]